MTKTDLRDRIKTGVFLLDGGMGSQIFARQVRIGRCPETLNLEAPDTILAIHTDYLNAGADAVLTNTFGANPITLARHGAAEDAKQINREGARIARRAAGRDRYVLGDLGPCGDFIEPLGTVKPADLKEAFALQARVLRDEGVDGFIIETMTALDEVRIAAEAVRSVCGTLPLFASMAFDRTPDGFRTMMGVGVAEAVAELASLGVDALGFNCGTATLEQYELLADQFVQAVKSRGAAVPVYAEPNAGKPNLVDGQTLYDVTAEQYADTLERIYAKGIRILGGCCGTTPAFIGAVAARLRNKL